MLDGVAGHDRGHVDGEQDRGGGADAHVPAEPERLEQRRAGEQLDAPGAELRAGRDAGRGAGRGRPEGPCAHEAAHREPRPRCAPRARSRSCRTTTGASTHGDQQQERREAEQEEARRARVEQVGRGDDDHAQQRQRDDVQRRLRDQRAEQHRERLAHASRAAGQHHGARRLAEARRERGRHQDPDHRRRGHVAAAQRAARQRRAGDRVPGRRRAAASRPSSGAVAISTQPASERTMLATTFWSADPVRGERRQADAEHARDAEPDAPGDAVARHRLGGRRVERGKPAGRAPRARRRSGASPAAGRDARSLVAGSGARWASLVDLLDLLGDARPGVARGAFRAPRAPWPRGGPARGRSAAAPRPAAAGRPAAPARRRRRR